MKTRKWASLLAIGAICISLAGCGYNSKNPLSDPKSSKPATHLAGIWRLKNENGDVTYFHVGSAGIEREPGAMRVHGVTHKKNGEIDSRKDNDNDLLFISTTLGAITYLSVTVEQNGPHKATGPTADNPDAGQGYFLMKYKVDGHSLLTWGLDFDAEKKAIADGKIKGLIETRDQGPERIEITDTTENLARYVEDASDSLFSKKVSLRLDRVK